MPPQFPFPENFEQDTAALMPDLMWAEMNFGSDALLKHFPASYMNASEVVWDQYQNPYGLIPVRAAGAAPQIVQMPGYNVFKTEPGFYGLETTLGEEEMTFSKQPNTINKPLDTADRLGKLALDASVMVVNRIRQTIGQFGVYGYFDNHNASGELVHRYQVDNYQTFAPANDGNTGPVWTNSASATPITDLVYWQTNYLNKGTSARFGPDSALLCNPITINTMWKTQQIQKTLVSDYGATYKRGDISPPKLNGDNSINSLMMGMGLPNIIPYEEGYYATLAAAISQDPTQFTYAIPDNTFIWVGKRDTGPVAALALTRHAGIGAYQSDKFPQVTVENESKIALSQGIYVVAEYQKLMPVNYRLQVGMNMAPLLYYYRGLAGLQVG